jgi:hypothetical protein
VGGQGAPDPEVARLAGVLALRFEELVDRLADRISAEIEMYRQGAVVDPGELRRSVTDNFRYMLDQMSTSDAPVLTAPRYTGRLWAQQGAPLPDLGHKIKSLTRTFTAKLLISGATTCRSGSASSHRSARSARRHRCSPPSRAVGITAYLEETDAYLTVIRAFLADVDAGR